MTYIDNKTYCDLFSYISHEVEHNIEVFYKSTTLPKWNGKVLGINENVPIELLKKIEFSNMDFSLGLSLPELNMPERKKAIRRPPSCRSFSDKKIDYQLLLECLSNAMTSDYNGRREYSSAGGLYATEIFIAIDSHCIFNAPENLKSGYYYLDNNMGKLVLISEMDSCELKSYIMSDDSYFKSSSFQVITVINTPKSIFKYKERGFRNSMIEIGAIHHILREVFSDKNIYSCESAEFDDHRLLCGLKLNPRVFKPILVQHFGYKK
ncbi:SagB/ThcOx family dehydrogenase [Photorhabdus stackebrandtii]|nr:SagB/ThcOx family dehydrogenase [Photorhabdus stackebrandtii]